MKLVGVFFILYTALHQASSSATVWVTLESYVNVRGTLMNNICCDASQYGGSCGADECDHYFIFCINDPTPNVTECLSEFTTGHVNNADNITFGNNIGTTRNPFPMSTSRWGRSPVWSVTVRDYDDGPSELADILRGRTDIEPVPAVNENHTELFEFSGLMSGTTLTLEVQVVCDEDFYGPNCTTFCAAMNNGTGHFDCDQENGQKICHAGWTGDWCNAEIEGCHSNPCVHGECVDTSTSFVCSCRPGYHGRYCEMDGQMLETETMSTPGTKPPNTANLVFNKVLSTEETTKVIDLLVHALAEYYGVRTVDIHITFTWSTCYGYKGPVSVVIFQPTIQKSIRRDHYLVKVLSRINHGNLESYLGIPLYKGDHACLPDAPDVPVQQDETLDTDVHESTSSGVGMSSKYLALGAVIALACLVAVAVIITAYKRRGQEYNVRGGKGTWTPDPEIGTSGTYDSNLEQERHVKFVKKADVFKYKK